MLKLAASLVVLMLASPALAGQDCKVTVCHLPGGDMTKVQALSVGVEALDAHLAHGDFLGFQGACYVLVEAPALLADAEQGCRDIGGHLVSIHGQQENDYVGTLADLSAVSPGRVWIGAIGTGPVGDFCSGEVGEYEWTDGSPWDFQNWRSGTSEPNGCGTAPPKDAVMFFSASMGANEGWNDVSGDGPRLSSVCKLEN